MDDREYIPDITELVKTFELNIETRIPTVKLSDSEKQIFTHIYSFQPKTEIEFNVNNSAEFFDTIAQNGLGKFKMKQDGKYWFDKRFTCDVVMKNFIINKNQCTAEYEGMDILDLTNYSLLARFLRWVLRR